MLHSEAPSGTADNKSVLTVDRFGGYLDSDPRFIGGRGRIEADYVVSHLIAVTFVTDDDTSCRVGLPYGDKMAYIIAEPCIGVKDTACVDACPVDCIHPRKNENDFDSAPQLYIDPVECIDCGACVPVCPVSAIFAAGDLPENMDKLCTDQC